MKKITIAVAAVLLAGCAGRAANPVMVQQYGDNAKSCQALELDMSYIESEVQRLVPDTEKTGKNVALGVTGAFFLVPLFFMDFSQAEQMEVNAYRQRYNHLAILAMEKGCETDRKPILKAPEPVKIERPKEEPAA
ncbi:hypothetical protein MTR80_06180 [Alcaligenes aquatilis]|uniref:Lipoprotein n=1 Tax=Alcaligenes aquatilis TaxID=323284 RepID=A0ABY4NJQ3_9BURK|nr:hypothetical protein [Alcaligenes aquatilis]UQN37289.1 hypothetical protein MTR80_06180 [Alcaligenes aquatilis]